MGCTGIAAWAGHVDTFRDVNTQMDLTEIIREDGRCMYAGQVRVQWQSSVLPVTVHCSLHVS